MCAQNSTGDFVPEPDSEHGRAKSPLFWGMIAIVGGIVLLLSQFMELSEYMPWVVLALGAVMLLWGIIVRETGGLIAGGIVTGVGLGLTLVGSDRMDAGEVGVGYFLLFLALGFLSIPLTTRLLTDETHWWALIPGGIILLVGLAMVFGGVFAQSLPLLGVAGALALVVFGAWLVWQARK